MKMFVISDNIDTYMGFRLAGVEGVVVHEKQEVQQAIAQVLENPAVGILLITEKLGALCPEEVEKSVPAGQCRWLWRFRTVMAPARPECDFPLYRGSDWSENIRRSRWN